MKTKVEIGLVVWHSDRARFESLAIPVQQSAYRFLTEMFGERCAEFEPNCECCKRWKALDEILDNPFANDPY